MAHARVIGPFRNVCAICARRQPSRQAFATTHGLRAAEESNLPRVATTSFWSSLIPKPFRRPATPEEAAERAQLKATRPKEWNPATIFIILGILVGSNAIQIISLRNEMLNFSRKTDAKLSLLREVVQRVKNGEDIDVKKALGTGDPQQEAEWEEVIKELENTDMLEEGQKKKAARREKRAEERRLRDEERAKAMEREGSPQRSDDSYGTSNERRPKFLM